MHAHTGHGPSQFGLFQVYAAGVAVPSSHKGALSIARYH